MFYTDLNQPYTHSQSLYWDLIFQLESHSDLIPSKILKTYWLPGDVIDVHLVSRYCIYR